MLANELGSSRFLGGVADVLSGKALVEYSVMERADALGERKGRGPWPFTADGGV